MNELIINKIAKGIKNDFYPNIHSLLIYKNDTLVFEDYYSGKDEVWGTDIGIIAHNENQLHDVRSISKSVVSACVGIAIDRGLIKNSDQYISDFFHDYLHFFDDLKKEIKIEHLLTMSAGLEWNETISYASTENSKIQMNHSIDPIAFVLSRNMLAKPGMVWEYNGGATQLLAAIIEKVSGLRIYEFANEYIFKAIGIDSFQWTTLPATGYPAAASGLRLRSRDLLKFGALYLNEGEWKGEKVIPSQWAKDSLDTKIKRPDGAYGYQFWMWENEVDNKTIPVIAAGGNGDQRIFIDKKNRLIVVCTAGNYNVLNIKNNTNEILKKIYTSFPFN